MKILSLYFRNINSLVGDSRINFTQGALANASVFAITGVNGSGKSSILDAITLGLYGETARFDQPAALVISQTANEAYAEVEFKLGQEKYQSTWQAQRGISLDDVQAIDMKLTRLSDGEVLANTPGAVCSAITELTGMSFRNFSRSMLLAQGDFAAFLNALDNERMTILETLIGTDIYTDYRNEIITNADKAQLSIDTVKQELADIKLLTPVAVEAMEHDLEDYHAQISECKASQKVLEQQQLALKNTANLQSQVVEQKKRIKDLQNQVNINEQSLDNIATAKLALAYQDDLAALDSKQQSLQQHKAAWNTLQNELQFLREQLGDNPEIADKAANIDFPDQLKSIDDIKFAINQTRLEQQEAISASQILESQLNEKKSALTTAQAWLAEHSSDEILVDNFPETARLKKLRAELNAISEQYKLASSGSKKSSTSIKNTSTALTKTAEDIVELKQALIAEEQARDELLQGHEAEKIDSLKAEQQERVQQFQELLNITLSYQKTRQPDAGFMGIFGRKPAIIEDADVLTQELEALHETTKREENIKLALEAAVNREALLKKLLTERSHLVDGKPCPLCGAKDHPYVKQPPSIGNSVQALTDQQMRLRGLSSQAEQLKKRIVIAQKNAEKNRVINAQLENIKSSWLSLCNRLNSVSPELDISNISEMETLLKDEQNELKNIFSLANQYSKKSENIAKITALIAKNEATIEQLHSTAAQLDNDSVGISQEFQEIEAALLQCRQAEQELSEKVTAQLSALGETMPSKGKEDAFFDRLNTRRQDYQTTLFHHNALQEEISGLDRQYDDYQAEIRRCEEKIASSITQLQSEELIGVHLALIEKQQLIAEKERLLNEQENQFSTLQQGLQNRLQDSPFASLGELRKAMQFLAREPEFNKIKADLQAQINSKNQQLERLSAELDNDFMIAETAPNPDDIYRQLTELVQKIDMAQLESQRLQKRLTEQTQLQTRFENLTESLAIREQEAQPALAERHILDTEHGMAFRRRVQIRIADKLISHANRVLEKISGRYYLRFNGELAGLALEIEDTFQSNARRQPRTLSGGESFVVSLALALSLAELANNNKSVESLFIDEGFGNLDGDSLTLVLSTLENLKAYGKSVGVISHVEAVRKRIKTQVQVIKRPNGLGMLKKAS